MSLGNSFQLPFGVRPTNPVPVDNWSGPFTGNSYSEAANKANSEIPSAIRFISMGVRLIVDDVPRMYWYSGGTADIDLVPFLAEGSGSQGFQGFQGPAGSGEGSGFQGFQGFQGNIGITGTQGFQGFQGNIGITGTQGFQGFQGNIGITGTQGFQGFQGNIGITGTQGFQGFQGNIGITGTQGFQGFQGFQGLIGITGTQGFQGFQGPKGSGKYYYGPTAPDPTDDGLTLGSKWFNTTVGAEFTYIVEGDDTTQWVMVNVFSATGPQGPAGSGSGEGSGAQGFQGFQGPPGSGEGSGSQGFQGNIGITGTQGFQGFQGNIGITGTQGFQGFQGNIGITGTQGFQGFQGPAGEGDGFTFSSDLPVNIAVGKSFGKYLRGDTIPALGKTIPEVLNLALNENIPPTVTLSRSPASIAFNNTSPLITLTFGYVINSPGATGASASLEYRLGSGSWTSLTSGTLGLTSFEGTFNHTPSLSGFNTSNLNYRYTVEDSAIPPETNTASVSVTQSAYILPTVTWGQSLVSGTTSGIVGESVTKRERGNRTTRISGSPTNQNSNITISSSSFVPMTDWIIERLVDSTNSADYSGITSASGLNTNSIVIPAFTDDASDGTGGTANPEIIRYRIRIKDTYNTSYTSPINSQLSQINLKYAVFYGPTGSVPSNSAGVRSLPSKIFSDVSTDIVLNTGTEYLTMFVAYPQNIELTRAYNNTTFSEETGVWLGNEDAITVTTEENNISKTYNTYYSTLNILPSTSQSIGLTSSGTETD